jgi:energy-coupling factor transport system substrate-specific component
MRQLVSGAIYAISGAIGVLAFIYPLLVQMEPGAALGSAHSQDALLVTTTLVALSLLALLVEIQGRSLSAKMVASLGILVAATSVLRFIDIALAVPGGFSPMFAPIIAAGYVFGGRFGFLMGTLTMLVSALITGGVGPWLPYQMFAAGWVGLSAGWLGRLLKPLGRSPVEVWCLAAFGFVWGIAYGAIMNLYFWPFASGVAEQSYARGLSWGEVLGRYAAFYVATSLAWDMGAALGNSALLLLLGKPVLSALRRFHRRFSFAVVPST